MQTTVPNDPILRFRDLQTLTRLSRTTIYGYIKAGDFPRPLKLGKRASGWRLSEVEAWLASRPRSGA
jgi:prophage regulatory protein